MAVTKDNSMWWKDKISNDAYCILSAYTRIGWIVGDRWLDGKRLDSHNMHVVYY